MVVPVYNAEDHLDESLRSLLGQRYRPLDVVVVDDGSTDGSAEIARRHAKDSRVRVITQANAGVNAARSAGIAVATGELLTFVDADDTVTPDGIAAAVRSLEESGSDVAVMPYDRLDGERHVPAAPWIRALHRRPATGVTLVERPDVMVNTTACSKVFRRSFWDAAGLEFPPGKRYQDQILNITAYREASAIDITDVVGYSWRRQETSISQGQVTVENVMARMDVADETLRLLEPLPDVRAERALQLLQHMVPNSCLKLDRTDDDAYLAVLVERVPRLVSAVPADRFRAEVPAQFRVLYALLEQGEHDRIWRFVRAEGLQPQLHPCDGATALLPGWGSDPVPPEAYELTADQAAMRSSVRDVRRTRDGVEIDVRAWFPFADAADLVATLDGRRMDVDPNGDDAVFVSRAGTERAYPGSGRTLTGPRPTDGELVLELSVPGRQESRKHRVKPPRL
ncbi:glycosyltransferase family 2 protein [Aeromicrobium terrae]|uniref:Glycosyltransferase n=1 Tax=Aeromicrobium terrae TaxID=2498846 RepID=A0A5C8NH12_9ACTN|nr:glycosyltransferase [Aeromicrobium terrae]TXL57920.1 glycosyltransferase [Aeromicrobium terrae]